MTPHDIVMPIGDAAKASGCAASAIRYYEEIGLMGRALRSGGGRRHYRGADVARLQFIRRARDFGMTIDQIRDLLVTAQGATPETCGPTRRVLAERLADVRAKRAELRALEGELTDMMARCDALCAGGGTCDILQPNLIMPQTAG